MRAGVEMHGSSAVFKFLLAHLTALGKVVYDENSPVPGDGGSRAMRVWRSNLIGGISEDDPELSLADMHADHLHLGTTKLPQIEPDELIALKTSIEDSLSTRVCTLVEPLTYSQGALGETSHDARTLLTAQTESGHTTCEIRFTVDRVHKDLFPTALRVLNSRGDLSIVSARVDERSACQVN